MVEAQHLRRAIPLLAIATVLCAVWPAASAGAPAEPDRSLGGDGTQAVPLQLDVTDAVKERSEAIVVGGIRDGHPAFIRLKRNGSLDQAYGTGGMVIAGEVFDVRDVSLELDGGAVRALVSVSGGPDRLLRLDVSPGGAIDDAVHFEGSAGVGDLTVDGGAVASFLDDGYVVADRYSAAGARDGSFAPAQEPSTRCNPMGTACVNFVPTALAAGESGAIVRTVDAMPSSGECVGSEAVTVLAPGADGFQTVDTIMGCGANEVFSIETDPAGRFLVSGWGGPPSRAQFVRLDRDGSLDGTFGEAGAAVSPPLGVDNLTISDPAFERNGAFFNSLTQPRKPTLRLRPSRFSASGRLDRRWESKVPRAVFGEEDGLTSFRPEATLVSRAGEVSIIGSGQSVKGRVPAIARWAPVAPRLRAKVASFRFPATIEGMATKGVRALTRCNARCRVNLILRVSPATVQKFGLGSRVIGSGERTVAAGHTAAVRARLSGSAEAAFRAKPGQTVRYTATVTAKPASGAGSRAIRVARRYGNARG